MSCRPGFFLPVKVLSRLFRRLFLERLEGAFCKEKLRFFGELAGLDDPAEFLRSLEPLREAEWVVYAKAPFGGPSQVLDYLGRYTHRVALSNERLLDVKDGQVTFQWKDYRLKGREKSRVMTLESNEFLRRFLIHVLPRGFQRIAHPLLWTAVEPQPEGGTGNLPPSAGGTDGRSAARSRQLSNPAPARRPGIDPSLPPLRQGRDGPHSDAGSGRAVAGFLMKMICPRALTTVLPPGSHRESLAPGSRTGPRNGKLPRFSRSLREDRSPVHAGSPVNTHRFRFSLLRRDVFRHLHKKQNP